MRSKIILIMAAVMLIYFSFFVVLQQFAIAPKFARLEFDEATKSMNRCVAALDYEMEVLDRMVLDWSAWDDSYRFAEDLNQEYIHANLNDATLLQSGLNFICFLNRERRPIWFRSLDLETEQETSSDWFSREPWPQDHPLLGPASREMTKKGILVLNHQPTLMATRPILTSTQQGPIHGYLIMGMPLGVVALERMAKQTQAKLAIWELEGAPGLKQDPGLMQLTPDSPYLIRELGETSLHIFTIYKDLNQQPALLLRSEVSRDITRSARAVARFSLSSVLLAGLALLVILYVSMRQTIVQPMVVFANQVAETRSAAELNRHILNRRDELGVVAKAFAKLMQELAEEKKQLAQRSYRSGKAEMAGSILHNIRNGLHPVAAFLDMLLSDIRDAPLEELARAEEELKQSDLDPQRRAQLLEFKNLTNTEMLRLLNDAERTLAKVLVHTKDVIKTTHSHKQGYVDSPSDDIALSELVSDAIKNLSAQVGAAVVVRAQPSVASFGLLHTDPFAVQQVLTNLMLYSPETPKPVHLVEVHALPIGEEGEKGLNLQIFHPDVFLESVVLERLFERGYTWGRMIPDQGLHWCANKVNELGGSLKASHSHEGLSFHLWLPRKGGVGEQD